MKRISSGARQEPPGMDVIRALADEAVSGTQLAGNLTQRRFVQVERDGQGNVIRSVEQIDEVKSVDFSTIWNRI